MPYIRKSVRFRRMFSGGSGSAGSALFLKLLLALSLLAIFFYAAIVPIRTFLKEVAGNIALSDATDMITAVINEAIGDKMSEGIYDYDYFVSLKRDEQGGIAAISANMARINKLSSELLQEVISTTNSGQLDLEIPLGNLLDSNLLLGRGPDIPVKIIMLTSSYADFRNELTSVGINQSKHQIILELTVEIDVLMPWEVRSTEVVSEVLIAETIVVGKVPETYFGIQ